MKHIGWYFLTALLGILACACMAASLLAASSEPTVFLPLVNKQPIPTDGVSGGLVLPIEVLGANGTSRAVTVDIAKGASAVTLSLQIHGLTYQNKASVRINTGSWVPLSNATSGLAVAAPGRFHGGIGGGFQTLTLSLKLPQGAVIDGQNTLAFRFNQTDGRSIGFRVLRFNLIDPQGRSLIPETAFRQENPNSWQPPLAAAADIAAGEQLWREVSLLQNPGGVAIKARCMDCHAQDGRDLKYYNYSNHSITERSKFHGLTQKQGEQIASYIRAITFPNPGRPWNPPFQPGPGLDTKPAVEWAAGAGIAWALDRDADMEPYLPGGGRSKTALIDANRRMLTVNRREMPVPIQFLDWNHWLPETHPIDAVGAGAFNTHGAKTWFDQIRKGLNGQRGMSQAEYIVRHWRGDMDRWKDFVNGDDERAHPTISMVIGTDTPEKYAAAYAANLWSGVKVWELMHEFDLHEANYQFYGTQGERRSWHSNRLMFNLAPHILYGDGADKLAHRVVFDQTQPVNDWKFLSDVWYEMSMILGGGARGSYRGGHHDNDWKYLWYFIGDGQGHVGSDVELHRPMLGLAMSYKAIQENDSGFGPAGPGTDSAGHNSWWGFNLRDGRPEIGQIFLADWPHHTPAQAKPLLQPLFAAWVEKLAAFDADQWNIVSDEFNRSRQYVWDSSDQNESYPDILRSEIITLRVTYQADEGLLTALADVGKDMYPRNDWDSLKVPVTTTIAVPGGLVATPGVEQVTLRWNPVPGATSYNLKRADQADGVFRTVAVAVDGTSYTDTLLAPDRTFFYAVSANQHRAVTAQSTPVEAVARTGLVAHWKFNESGATLLQDSSTSGLRAERIGDVTHIEGKNGSAVQFGTRSFVSVDQNLARWTLGSYTLTAWVKTSERGQADFNESTPALTGSWQDPAAPDSLDAGAPLHVVGGLDDTGRIGVRYTYAGQIVRSSQPINDGGWHHIAIMRDGASGEVQIYVDGVHSASGVSGKTTLQGRVWAIGRLSHESLRSWPGALDDVRLYNYALSASEVQGIFNAP